LGTSNRETKARAFIGIMHEKLMIQNCMSYNVILHARKNYEVSALSHLIEDA